MDGQALAAIEQELSELLAASAALDPGRNGHLVHHPARELRKDRTCRITFEWACAERVRYNLVAGPGAADEFARCRSFHAAYPEIGIRPVALIQASFGSVAVLEHFEGRSLEQSLAVGAVSVAGAKALLDGLIDRLDAQAHPAGMEVFDRELEAMREELQACPVWGTVDLHFLDAVVFPYLRSACEGDYLRQRWTTGDFIARNILLGEGGDVRLIDCEFASRTACAPADLHRFGEFSEAPSELLAHVRGRLPGDLRWWRVHFCVDQACKLARVRRPEAFAPHAPALLRRMWRDLRDVPATAPASCLFDFLGDLDALARHADGLQTRYDALHTHAGSLQARYEELLRHSNTLQGHYEALARHRDDLQARCAALTVRADSAESMRDTLAQRLARLQRPWLWFKRR